MDLNRMWKTPVVDRFQKDAEGATFTRITAERSDGQCFWWALVTLPEDTPEEIIRRKLHSFFLAMETYRICDCKTGTPCRVHAGDVSPEFYGRKGVE